MRPACHKQAGSWLLYHALLCNAPQEVAVSTPHKMPLKALHKRATQSDTCMPISTVCKVLLARTACKPTLIFQVMTNLCAHDKYGVHHLHTTPVVETSTLNTHHRTLHKDNQHTCSAIMMRSKPYVISMAGWDKGLPPDCWK